ncbi:diacylglycerol/lipid kinase family protein [Agrococcus jenensis]|uniref:Diacylglycerol kinase family enzyme n=1 Tax=Agrococcus jenensis TaxID=46353 RepID=A0A3N2AQ83_9MICO|nr:diacylglycerol kinase family protein [Agrococcus jenensis]ROR65213.1 diacylglycerol kinase family enzyme [Agrococcus jenensis]
MRAAIVYNPSKMDRDTLAPQIESAQPLDWSEPFWIETDADDAGEAAVRTALEQGVDLLLVAGGDGTVRVAADAATGARVPLAIIPAGTGNLLARNLGIDVTNLRNAVQTAFDGEEREIDLGELEIEAPDGTRSKHAFAVMVGFGLDAEMIDKTDEDLKKKVGWLAYVDAAGRVISSLDKVRVHVRLDGGRTVRSTVNTMLIGNCGTVTNGIIILPDAAVDDGMLDIALVRPRGVRGWLQLSGYIARNNMLVTKLLRRRGHLGRQRTGAALGYGQAKETQARLEEPRAVQVDGDVVGEAIALRAGIRQDALVVRVPKEHARDAGPAV